MRGGSAAAGGDDPRERRPLGRASCCRSEFRTVTVGSTRLEVVRGGAHHPLVDEGGGASGTPDAHFFAARWNAGELGLVLAAEFRMVPLMSLGSG